MSMDDLGTQMQLREVANKIEKIAEQMPSLRDQFAMAALPRYLDEFWGGGPNGVENGTMEAAIGAYQAADAMMEARKV